MGDGELARAAARHARVHLPAVQPDPDADRGAERRGRARAAGASRRAERRRRAAELLERVGLGAARRPPARRSCRAASSSAWRSRGRSPTSPRVLLADEPTGNLDTATGEEIVALLTRLSADEGLSVVLITHDPSIADAAARVVRMRDGRVLEAVARRMRILVVDDEPALRASLERALRLDAYDVRAGRGRPRGARPARRRRRSTRSCSTWRCRSSTGSRSAAACARPATARRC